MMNKKHMTYETYVQRIIDHWDSLIANLQETTRCADPLRSAQCDEEIRILIARREALRRGLIQLDPNRSLPPSSR